MPLPTISRTSDSTFEMAISAAFLNVLFIVNLTEAQSAPHSEVEVYRAVLSDRSCGGFGSTAGGTTLVIHPTTESLEKDWWLPRQGRDLERILAKYDKMFTKLKGRRYGRRPAARRRNVRG